jgi:hypothetical protein
MLQEAERREHDHSKIFDDCQVRSQLDIFPIHRERGKFFDALQEQASQDAYGTMLGRLVCFYVRLLSLQDEEQSNEDDIDDRVVWYQEYPLQRNMRNKFDHLIRLLEPGAAINNLDEVFHETIKGLFCWTESTKLLEEVDCPVQRFLMVACLRDRGNGFIHVRDITPLIAKLTYSIRATVFMELLKRDPEELRLGDDLDGLQIYVKDLIQSPFGFLSETMHLAATVAGYASALPQIMWLGDDFESLTIHGKRVDLKQLRTITQQLLKDVQRKFRREIKMGLPGFKHFNWEKFDPEDDMGNTDLNASFILKAFKGKRKALLEQFLDNKVTNDYFTKGRVGSRILWNKQNCISWMKKCKQFLGVLATACYLLSGQPSRGTEMATLRWKNSVDEQRGLYWAQGTVLLLGQYSKLRSMSSQNRLIPRLDWRMMQLISDSFRLN